MDAVRVNTTLIDEVNRLREQSARQGEYIVVLEKTNEALKKNVYQLAKRCDEMREEIRKLKGDGRTW